MSDYIGLNLFEMNTVGHISHGLWVHPENTRHRYADLDFWVEQAQLLEEGLFDAVFLADVIGAYDTFRGGPEMALREGLQSPNLDPLLVVPAMAAVTNGAANDVPDSKRAVPGAPTTAISTPGAARSTCAPRPARR